MPVPKDDNPHQEPHSGSGAADAASHAHSSHSRDFINKGSRFMFMDNVSKVAEPLLVLACAKAYAGGDWGMFKYYESLILLLTRLGSLGLDRGVIWIYSRCKDDVAFVRRFSRCVNLVFLISSAIFLFVLMQRLGYLPAIGSWAKKIPQAPAVQFALYLACVPVQACALMFLQSLLNKRVLYYGMLVKNLIVPVAIYGPALLLSFSPWKSEGLALPYLFGNLLGLVLSAYGFLNFYRFSWKDWAFSASPSRELLRFSLPLASTDFFMSFAYRIDILLLGRYWGIKEVEIYSVIVMVANTLRSLRQSFDGIMLAVFSSEPSRTISEHQRRNFNYASWLVTTVQVPFFFLAIFFGRQLLTLIAPVYGEGHRVLVIATFFGLLTTVGAFSGQLLVGMGKTFMIPVSQVAFFVVSTALNFLLVPRYGAEGAAFATGLSLLISGMVCFAAIWFFAGTPVLRAGYVWPLASGTAVYAAATAAHVLIAPPLAFDIALFALASALFALHARWYWKKFNAGHP